MDCDYKDDGGATVELNVNNNLNSNSLFLKSSANLLETNNNEHCIISEESDAPELRNNGIVEGKHAEKKSIGEIFLCTKTNKLNGDLIVEDECTKTNSHDKISVCTIINQINKDLAIGDDKSECKSLPEVKPQSSMSIELSSAVEENLVENGSSTNQVDNPSSASESEYFVVDQTDVSDNGSGSEKTIDCSEKLADNSSAEGKQNSNSSLDLENCSENISDIPASTFDFNLQSNSDTLQESIPVKSDVSETCINTKSNNEISETESIPPSSKITEVLDESVSEEEVYLEVDDVDEQESDFSVEKQEAESEEQIDLECNDICDDVSDSLKASDLVSESTETANDVSTNRDISSGKSYDESIVESEVFVEDDGLCEKECIDLETSSEKQDAAMVEKSSEVGGCLNLNCEIPQIEPESEVPSSLIEQIQSEMKIFCENESIKTEVSEKSSDINLLESNIAAEENSSDMDFTENSIDMDTSENGATAELNNATKGNSSTNATDMDTNENAKTNESNNPGEENSSTNATDMDTIENAKANESNNPAEGNSSTNSTDMDTRENTKTIESNIPTEGISPINVMDMDANENAKSVESNIAAKEDPSKNVTDREASVSAEAGESNFATEGNSLKNATDIEVSESSKTVESNIAVEENSSKNLTDMETSEKTNELDDFVVLSDIDWSDDDEDASGKQKTKVETQNVEKDKCVQNDKNDPKEIESLKDAMNENPSTPSEGDDFDLDEVIEEFAKDKQETEVDAQNVEKQECVQNEKKGSIEGPKDAVNENPGTPSDGDDFDLDDVIEEFAKEEEKNKVVKLSDDELDDLVEAFVEAECSSPSAEKKKESESNNVASESDDEMELLIEDFKAVDSDNDCFIVQDADNVVVINDDYKDSEPKKKKSKPNDSQSYPSINSSDNVKSDTISNSHNLSNLESEVSDNISNNDATVVQENEIKVVNNETNTEKNKTFEIGSFKSEIFDNEAEGNKQNNDGVLLEILNNANSESTINKGGISILSALPLSERTPGKKVTLECRTDGVYLRKDQNADTSSQCTNEKSEQRNTNTVLNDCDKLSVDHSVTNSTNSNFIAEEQCMDDMLSKVCASNASKSASNEECKNIADGKESIKGNTSIHLEENQMASLNGEVKSLGSLCHDTLEASKKRKSDVLDNKPEESQKKIKTEVNGVETDMESASSSFSLVDTSVRKKVLEHFKEAFPTKVQLKKSWLEKLSKRLCQETIWEAYQQKIAQQNEIIKNLEDKLQALEDELCYSQSQATTFLTVQQELFQKHQFVPQTAVRTVAVNVKIFRECDVPQPMPAPVPSKVEIPTHTTEIHGSTPVSSTPPIKVQVPQQKLLPVQQTALPQTVASARFVSNPIQPRAVATAPQRFVAASPNVTMMKKEVPSAGMSSSQPVRPRTYLTEKSQPPPKSCKQLIDLTDEESSRKLMPASSTLVSLASNSVSKVNMPGLPNNQNVLLPLNGLFQMVPASTPNAPQFSLSNPVQVQQVSRQALVPALPPNLLGPRTVAYIIPSNTGQMSTVGRNPLPVPMPNFVPGPNQRLQTLIVRVTNPGQVPPPMGTVINTNARMPVLSQGIRNQTVKNSPIHSSASDLVLFPRQPKHPAPFPALPEYRPNPQLKSLPPKPSLKGSKAPNGIILSWNMSLLSLHAEISNYQLFAYQEAPGPVNASLWKKVGDVKALPLPMACTLTQFAEGNRYYFTVRAVDIHNRFGPYSDAVSILFSDIKDK